MQPTDVKLRFRTSLRGHPSKTSNGGGGGREVSKCGRSQMWTITDVVGGGGSRAWKYCPQVHVISVRKHNIFYVLKPNLSPHQRTAGETKTISRFGCLPEIRLLDTCGFFLEGLPNFHMVIEQYLTARVFNLS